MRDRWLDLLLCNLAMGPSDIQRVTHTLLECAQRDVAVKLDTVGGIVLCGLVREMNATWSLSSSKVKRS